MLITGGVQGIGEACLRMLVQHGAETWFSDLAAKTDVGKKLCSELGPLAHWVPMDINSDSDVASAIETVLADGKPIFGLVNNAGIVGVGGFMAPLEDYRKQFETNGIGSIRVAQAVLPSMLKAKEGVVIQIASLGGLLVPHDRAAYAVSKHAALAIPKIIAEEYAAQGVRSVGICPNRVDVPAAINRAMSSATAYRDMMGTQASGSMIAKDEIAWMVYSALMPGMRHWNGDVLTISDGAICSLRQSNFPEGYEPKVPSELLNS